MRGQSPAQGGTDHTSHRLIAFGLIRTASCFVLIWGGVLIRDVQCLAGSIQLQSQPGHDPHLAHFVGSVHSLPWAIESSHINCPDDEEVWVVCAGINL